MAFRRPKHASIKSGFDVDFLRYLENTARFTTVTTSAAAAINLKPLAKDVGGGGKVGHFGGPAGARMPLDDGTAGGATPDFFNGE